MVGLKVKIEERDHGYKSFVKLVDALKREHVHVKIGVLDNGGAGSEVREGGISNAQLAAVHEFGTATVPERPFLRPTFEEGKPRYVRQLGGLLKRVFSGGMTVDGAFQLMGMKIADDVKKRIVAQDPSWPPLAPETIARKAAKTRKGSTGAVKALIDTARMLGAITWELVRGVRP